MKGAIHLVILILAIPLVLAIAAGGADRAAVEAIHEAAGAGDTQAVRQLLDEDSGLVEARDEAGSTPLHTASRAGMLDVVKLLVARGADVEAGDNENTAPLGVAAIGGDAAVIEFLISRGADPLAADDNKVTALHWAATGNHPEIVRMLLDLGADNNASSLTMGTPLHIAAYSGYSEALQALIDSGADLNIRNTWGFTPLAFAAYRGRTEAVRMLLDAGADMNIWADWQSPLHAAAQSGNPETVSLLISRGMDVNAGLERSVTPLMTAIGSGNFEVVKLLLDNGADVNGGEGNNPLRFAVMQGSAETVESLIDRGADLNAEDEDGTSPLDAAVRQGYAEIAGILIKHGAEVNVADPYFSKTPLHEAAAAGNTGIVGMLLANGSDMNARDAQGLTPLDLAARYGHSDVARLLGAKGAEATGKVENYGYCGLLGKRMPKGEAVLWYTGHCGWAVKTAEHFLIFDYWNRGGDPATPCLANGHIDPGEIADLDVTVFVTHEHADHFDTTIFDWAERVRSIQFVYGFRPEDLPQYRRAPYRGPEYTYLGPRETAEFNGMKVSTIRANDAGVGYLVEVDGIVLYHAGDHAGWAEGEKQAYLDEIDYLARTVEGVDIAFLNVTGCHAHDPEALKEGTYYSISKLSPRAVIPTHAGGREFIYAKAINEAARDGVTASYACPRCRGDRFLYSGGRIQQDMRDTSS
jgi:ankyrin repeat protein/L-ascorbate metabolism protein UlaG (beta-lactamase superfamily)